MARKTIDLSEVGFDKRYYPVCDTHNNYDDGGRKIHIEDSETGRCLCGYEPWLGNAIYFEPEWGNIVNYLSQPDPDGNLCMRCKVILINALKV